MNESSPVHAGVSEQEPIIAPPANIGETFVSRQHVIYLCRPLGVPDHDRCNALADRFASATVIEWQHNPGEYVWHTSDSRHYAVRSFGARRTSIGSVVEAFRFLYLVLRSRADIAIVYGYQVPLFFVSALLLRLKGVHTISMNDSKFDDYHRLIFKDLAKFLLLAPYHSILAATRRAAEYVRYLGRAQIGIYHCAIDTGRVRRLAQATWADTPFAARPFISIARFLPKKNHRRLLCAFERYASRAERPRRLLLCGYGPLEADIRKQIADSETLSGLVDVVGFVSSDEIPALLGRSLALLLPSVEEQFGIVVTEAFAAGIPVMLSQECGAVDIVIEGEQGFVVRSDNEVQMARVMSILASDEAVWRALSTQAAAGADRADVRVFTNEVERLSTFKQGKIRRRARA